MWTTIAISQVTYYQLIYVFYNLYKTCTVYYKDRCLFESWRERDILVLTKVKGDLESLMPEASVDISQTTESFQAEAFVLFRPVFSQSLMMWQFMFFLLG